MIAIAKPQGIRWVAPAIALVLVILWTVPTFGLLVSSLRDKDQLSSSGWWTALQDSERNTMVRSITPDQQSTDGDSYVLSGNALATGARIIAFGHTSREPEAFKPGDTATLKNGSTLTVAENGDYEFRSQSEFKGKRGKRIFVRTEEPPRFTTENYREVIFAENLGRAFFNTLTVTIPATIIPVLVAAFAAYALSWMKFPGRAVTLAIVVGLLVVPLQMSLIPLLKLHNNLGIGKSYLGVWLAHTAFGLPLAIFLLRNYISNLPAEIIDSARVDGASDFNIFVKIVLPLSFPALASFAIFQFLWVWNDLLIATVFLGNTSEQLVMTGSLRELLGSRGGNWEILTASAFVSIAVPLGVFFSLQRYLVSGLLAGSVK